MLPSVATYLYVQQANILKGIFVSVANAHSSVAVERSRPFLKGLSADEDLQYLSISFHIFPVANFFCKARLQWGIPLSVRKSLAKISLLVMNLKLKWSNWSTVMVILGIGN